jgi:hypothetical protein
VKKILLFALLLSSFCTAETRQKQTLLQGNAQHGGFAALGLKLGKVDDAWYGMLGFRFGWIINRSFSIGAAYYDMARNMSHYEIYAPDEVQPTNNNNYYIFDTNLGGLELEYILYPDRQIHFGFNTLMGIGHIRYLEPIYSRAIVDDRHLFIEPTLNINLNVSNHTKLIWGFSYKYTTGVKTEGLSDKSLSGLMITGTFAVGIF